MKLTLVSLALLFFSFSSSAQNAKQMKRAQADADGIATELKLDDETKQKVYEIYIMTYATLKEIRKEGLPKDEMKQKNKAAYKVRRENTKALLGTEKGKEYMKYLKQVREAKKAKN